MGEKDKIFKWLDELDEQDRIHREKAGLRVCKGCKQVRNDIRKAVEKLKE